MGRNLTHDIAPWRFGMLRLGPYFLANEFSGAGGATAKFLRMTADYQPIIREPGDPMIDFFPKADCKFIPPPVDEPSTAITLRPKTNSSIQMGPWMTASSGILTSLTMRW